MPPLAILTPSGWEAAPIVAPKRLTLAQSAVAAAVTGTLVETVLASIVVPAGMMGPNGSLIVTATWSHSNNANTRRLIVNFGGTPFQSIPITVTSSTESSRIIRNRGAVNSQVSIGTSGIGFQSSGTGKVTAAVNTAVNQTLTLSAQLFDIAETITLEGYTVEVIPG